MGVHESIAAFERHLLFDEAGRFAGWCDENLALPDGWAMAEIPDGFTEADAGEWCFADGHVMRGADAAPDERQRQAVIELMRAQAQQRIEALAWRIERATERSTIGVAGETPSDVLAEREALRRAQGRLEEAAKRAATLAQLQAITFEVLPQDWPALTSMTPLAFFSRFTPQEQAAILDAARSNGALQSIITGLQLSQYVDLADERISAGVQMLEAAGLLGAGRAAQILAEGGQG